MNKKPIFILLFLILGILVFWRKTALAQEQEVVRIGLAFNLEEIRLAMNDRVQLFNTDSSERKALPDFGDQALITASGETIFINDLPVGRGPVLVLPKEGFLSWNDRSYRGDFLIINQGGKLSLVNRLLLEEYLRGVIPKEIPAGWPMAALKAQTIAARTYTLANLNRHQNNGCDLCATTHCQVYEGISGEHPNADRAVAETNGLVITYNGKLISAVYHDSSGGHTKDASEIWANAVPYLKGVPDWDFNSPYLQWTRVFTWEELQASLTRSYPEIGGLKQILPVASGNDGRIIKLALKGDRGEVTVSGEQFRFAVGIPSSNIKIGVIYGPEPYITLWWLRGQVLPEAVLADNELPGSAEALNPPWDLPDPWSWLQDKEPRRLVVRGAGRGHGVGLSQWGAKGMAEAGYNEIQILEHFYIGTTVTRIVPGRKIAGEPISNVSE